MQRAIRWLVGGWLFSLVTLTPWMAAEAPPEVSREEVIETAYLRLGEYTAWPASPGLSFELAEFEHFSPAQFDELLYAELATLTGGDVISVAKTSHYLAEEDLRYARYLATWNDHDPGWQRSPEGHRMLSMTVAELLAEAAASDEEMLEVAGITRYRVQVSLDGRAREYRAAFLWLPAHEGESFRFRVFDHVSQGVTEAAAESLPTLERARQERSEAAEEPVALRPERALRPPSGISWAAAPFGESCEATAQAIFQHGGFSDPSGHWSGSHFSHADFEFECSCSDDCSSTCTARILGGSGACDDTGTIWDACHHMAEANDASSDYQGNGTTTGAGCGAGFGCIKKACAFCACGISVSVSVAKREVSFSTSGDPDWAGNVKASATCERCTLNHCESALKAGSAGLFAANCIPGDDNEPRTPGTPIVLDLAGDGFRFTSPSEGTRFDLDADGVPELIAWTVPGDDAFLALDRNRNGRIDGGRELFGDSTPVPVEVTDRHGYAALSGYDHDGDAAITADDPVFGDLWLWLDRNGDGQSQPAELYSLGAFGVESIEIDYEDSRRRDRHGNLLRYWSRARVGEGPERMLPGQRSHTQVVDVLLQEAVQ